MQDGCCGCHLSHTQNEQRDQLLYVLGSEFYPELQHPRGPTMAFGVGLLRGAIILNVRALPSLVRMAFDLLMSRSRPTFR